MRIGQHTLGQGELERLVRELAPEGEQLRPPLFGSCVKHQESVVLGVDGTTAKQDCEQRYRQTLHAAVGFFLTTQWLLGEAERIGVRVSAADASARARQQSGVVAGVTRGADAELEARAELAAAAIRASWMKGEPPVTNTQIAAYYDQHRMQYRHLERRDILIAENLSYRGAIRLKREVETGRRSLMAVALHEDVERFHPKSRNTTKEAMRAIFSAEPHSLTGPIKLNALYAIFTVRHVVPAGRDPLGGVRARIRLQLVEDRRRYLEGKIADWRARWTARTSCARGYVVPGCKQYTGKQEPEDALSAVLW